MSLWTIPLAPIRNTPDGRRSSDQKPRGLQVHVAMLGARQHYAVPKSLHRAGMLGRLYTDAYAGNKARTLRLFSTVPSKLRPKILERFLGRTDGELPSDKVVSFDAFGAWYIWRTGRTRDTQALARIYAEGAGAFARRVLRHGLQGAEVLYSFNGPAPELFAYAKEQNIPCILEQTLAPQDIARALLREELEHWPGWEPRLSLEDVEDIMGQREQMEWQLADLIMGGSSFVIDGLRQHQVPEAKCRMVPYGVPLERFPPKEQQRSPSSSTLRILFVGGVELRKGVPYLLEALRLLNSHHIEARFAGPVSLSVARIQPYQAVATFLGPVPRTWIAELYRWADLLVLPSICEGSALVTYEALASGLPIIATPNTGAWVQNGIDGLIVPIREVEALAAALERFVRDREFLRFCSHNALTGRDRLGLDAYRQRLAQIIQEVMRWIPAGGQP